MKLSNENGLIWDDFSFEGLNAHIIAQQTQGGVSFDKQSVQSIIAESLQLNQGVFTGQYQTVAFPLVDVNLNGDNLHVYCTCTHAPGKLCEHEGYVLSAILQRDEFRIFFDHALRLEKLKKFAADYGMDKEPNLDEHFAVDYANKRVSFSARHTGLIPITTHSLGLMKASVLTTVTAQKNITDTDEQRLCVLLRQHKYYGYLIVELFRAKTTKDGKIKNPLTSVAPLDMLWETDDPQAVKFFTGIHKFQSHSQTQKNESDLPALRAIINNPLNYNFYRHDGSVSENVTAASVFPVKVSIAQNQLSLKVDTKAQFYELSGQIKINNTVYKLNELQVMFTYFLAINNTLYLVDNKQLLGVIALLKNKPDNLLVHTSKYPEFKKQLLTNLEDHVGIEYKHIKPATAKQLEQQGFKEDIERLIYLSDFGQHVMLIPVIRYGEVEIPIRSRRQIFSADIKGTEFKVQRSEDEEIAFTSLLVRQHPYFDEQLENDLHYFYLHKKRFLQEDWFLNTFEHWQQAGVTILGFNELEGNKLNPNKVKITIQVLSGINWFNTIVKARFGKKKAALQHIQRAIKNKSKYVQLDDGTMGILPEEWIAKFTNYFNSGEIADDETIRTPKINFAAIDLWYEQQLLDEGVKKEISFYRDRLANFDSIKAVDTPAGLNGTLRNYQKQGLNWLNFLDDFNFGGCLADDMGLGKTIQIIAFILLQRAKAPHNVNLLVVPTSLIFNWQAEVAKFAPSIRIHTIYGADRIKNTEQFEQYEIILTSYGTLLADINFLKDYQFNYVFLDESQLIKNPESQRYKTVRLLKSRNKIVITGTPMENNSYDLYGQLSFACPGLLGSKQYFKDIYLNPIDQFKNSKRLLELQAKIKPFVLRRTKQEVAKELPDKTEMVLYCEMGAEQRRIYDAYEKEFREFISATTNDEIRKSPMNVLKGLTRLRQICDSPILLGDDKVSDDGSAKIDMLIEEITGKMGQHKILVFSQFVTMLNLIRKELTKRNIRFSYLTGSTGNRQSVVKGFQEDNEIRVFLISLKAGGTGLNLTEADYVYLVDPWWNPAVENQAIDRSHRIGQNKNIVAVRMICTNTVEEKILLVQQTKRELTEGLIQANNSFIGSLTKTDLLNLLSKSIPS
ncbi:SNF2 family DNA or RNA helicase [Mucilaginibacter gracilis]|uniref:SNF2 family DNA or RNA helicase n=1 Tax=Mucilaginibacter gracilis TaxID=423350 RepID=A0A495J3X7_9SPHI|nr:DEAD/DEAH box helicase [Mucilaginibacter gracilis]RKR83680.1 SNF2 family DNA or RNA helicase [Mucilaginibacter gracilis]